MKRLMLVAVAVGAARAAAEQLPMEHVLVSVPLHKKTAETALPVTVLAADELHRAAASTLGDTLERAPGLANASFGPGVGQPVIRGQQGARVTVLQNGTSSADASNLSADHAVAVEPMLADSIEVLRGPSTLLYGGGAIGGVVNIVDGRIPTSLGAGLSGGAEYRHDSASDMDTAVLRLDGGAGPVAFHFDALYRDWDDLEIPGLAIRESSEPGEEDHGEDGNTDGYIANTGGHTENLTFGSSYHFEDGFFGLAVSRLENEYGVPAGAHGHHGEDPDEHAGENGEGEGIRIDVEQTRYDAALHWHEPLAVLEVMRGFITYTDYGHAELEGGGEVGTRYNNETWEGRLELVHRDIGNFHGVLGLQARSGEFSALGEEAFIPMTDSRGLGLFLLEDYHRGNWTVEGGLRLDRDERDPDSVARSADFTAISVSGSALWQVSPEWQLGLALSRAERAPAIEELYSNVENDAPDSWVVHAATGAIELGNPDLDTEVSRNIDLSVAWSRGVHLLDITLFYNDFSDYINLLDTGQQVDGMPVLAYIQEDALFYGVEVNGEFALAELGSGQLTLGLTGDSIRGELANGEDVPRLPPWRIGGRLSWTGEALALWASVVDAADQDRPGLNEEPTEGYTRWDAGAEYRLVTGGAELLLFLQFRNLGDEEIRLSTSFLRDVAPEAGRSVEAGVRYSF